jgi:hypothetical protein
VRSTGAAPAGYVSPLDPAIVYAGLERRDDAFAWLERALEAHDPGLVYLGIAPAFATLHQDPRFAALLRKVGLASERKSEPPAGETEGEQR